MYFIERLKLTHLSVEEAVACEADANWLQVPVVRDSGEDALLTPSSYKVLEKTKNVRFMLPRNGEWVGTTMKPTDLIFCTKTPEQLDCAFAQKRINELLESTSGETLGYDAYAGLCTVLVLITEKYLAEESRK